MLNKQPQIKESEKETPAFTQADALIPETEAQRGNEWLWCVRGGI